MSNSDTSKQIVSEESTSNPVMVAFAIPQEIGAQLLSGVESNLPSSATPISLDQLHITLAYLGDASGAGITREQLIEIVSKFASDFGNSLSGKISGFGLFNIENDVSCLYASFDSPALPDFHQALVEYLNNGGANVENNHGFTPHISLAYLPSVQPDLSKIQVPNLEITFDKITVAWSRDWISIPLHSSAHESDGGGDGGNDSALRMTKNPPYPTKRCRNCGNAMSEMDEKCKNCGMKKDAGQTQILGWSIKVL